MIIKPMSLTHYSDTNILVPRSVRQNQEDQPSPKPEGLWMSVDGEYDWLDWCESENYNPDCLRFRHGVSLHVHANVLKLDTQDSILSFAEKYGQWPSWGAMTFINWLLVARDFDGLVIAPYQWSLRLDERVTWYYGWDCASGCIWHRRAIRKVRLAHSV